MQWTRRLVMAAKLVFGLAVVGAVVYMVLAGFVLAPFPHASGGCRRRLYLLRLPGSLARVAWIVGGSHRPNDETEN